MLRMINWYFIGFARVNGQQVPLAMWFSADQKDCLPV
jgi:hypothetical protein